MQRELYLKRHNPNRLVFDFGYSGGPLPRGEATELTTANSYSFYDTGSHVVKTVVPEMSGRRAQVTTHATDKTKLVRVGSIRGITTGENMFDDRIVYEGLIHYGLRRLRAHFGGKK